MIRNRICSRTCRRWSASARREPEFPERGAHEARVPVWAARPNHRSGAFTGQHRLQYGLDDLRRAAENARQRRALPRI